MDFAKLLVRLPLQGGAGMGAERGQRDRALPVGRPILRGKALPELTASGMHDHDLDLLEVHTTDASAAGGHVEGSSIEVIQALLNGLAIGKDPTELYSRTSSRLRGLSAIVTHLFAVVRLASAFNSWDCGPRFRQEGQLGAPSGV